MLGKMEGRRRREQQRMRWLDGTTDSMDLSLSKLRGMVKHREAWRAAGCGITRSQTRLSDCTTTTSMVEDRRKKTGRGQLDVNELLKARCGQLHSIEPWELQTPVELFLSLRRVLMRKISGRAPLENSFTVS